jgi:CAI-1 autoinducer synthase
MNTDTLALSSGAYGKSLGTRTTPILTPARDGRVAKTPMWMMEGMQPGLYRINNHLKPYPFELRRTQKSYIALHQNDYLGLSCHQEVQDIKLEVLRRATGQPLASTLFSGQGLEENELFHQALAKAMRAEATLLVSSGWAANVGLVEALAQRDTPIYLDQKAHMSLWSGAKLSSGRPVVTRHNDPEALERRIRLKGPGIVCIDAIYSSNGAVADLRAYVEICERTGSVLIVDEAHSLLMLGESAGGLAVEQDVAHRIHFRTASFSKATGGHGGCIVGSRHDIWYLKHRSFSSVFSSAPLEVDCAAHRIALEIAQREPERAQRAFDMAALLRSECRSRGIDTGPSASQIVSVELASEYDTCQAFGKLRERGILTSVFIAPAAPLGRGFLRLSVHCNTSAQNIVTTADALREVIDEISRKEYMSVSS